MSSPWVNAQPSQNPWLGQQPMQDTQPTDPSHQAPPGLPGSSAGASNDPLTALWQTSLLTQQSVQQLVQAQLHTLQVNEAQRGFGQLRPKKEVRAVECLTDRGCMTERIEFEIDVEELGAVKSGEVAFKQLRSVAKAPAKDVIELYLAQGTGQQLLEQAAQSPAMPGAQGPRHHAYHQLYMMLWTQLEASVNLTPERRTVIADAIMHEARMLTDDVSGAESFIRSYRVGELALVRAGLRPNGEALLADEGVRALRPQLQSQLQALVRSGQQRDLNVMMEQKISKSVFTFIRSLPIYDQPTNPHEVIQCMYRWIESQRRSQSVTMNPPIAAGSKIQTLQAVHPQDEISNPLPANTDVWQQPGLSEDVYVAAVDGSFHYIGALTRPWGMNASNARRLASSNLQGVSSTATAAAKCSECQGTHADVKQCPGTVARNDPGYKLIPGSKMLCKWKCFGKHPCDGNNHFSKHHRQQLKAERGQMPTLKGKGKGKGKAKGQFVHIKGKGKGKHIASMSADGTCTYWVDEEGSWYDAAGTHLVHDGDVWPVDGSINAVSSGCVGLDFEEDEGVLDSRLAECQQDEITELQSCMASWPAPQGTVSSVQSVGPASVPASQQAVASTVPCVNGSNSSASVPSIATGKSPQAVAWSQGQQRMASMRRMAVMVSEGSLPEAENIKRNHGAGSTTFQGAGGARGGSAGCASAGTAGGLFEFAGGSMQGAGSSGLTAGGEDEIGKGNGVRAKGNFANHCTTVFH